MGEQLSRIEVIEKGSQPERAMLLGLPHLQGPAGGLKSATVLGLICLR